MPADNNRTDTVIVLVHGLWMNGMDMSWLKRRLRKHGYTVRQFRYRSMCRPPAYNARALGRFVDALPHPTAHFVGHSLGGIVIRHFFAAHAPGDLRPGRVVTLGTPHTNSSAAARLRRCATGRAVLGKSVERGLGGDIPPWSGERELGSIAGTYRLGLGILLPNIPKPNDSAVTVAETRLPNMTDHLRLRVSHLGMLLSPTVAMQCAHFIRYGRFKR